MSSRSVSASWEPGPLRCDVVGDGFSVAVDEPVSVGGTADAPQPTDLFLASVASCFALALVYSARKRSIALESVRVAVVGDYGAGCRFDAVHVEAEVVGPTAAEIDALRTAAERVCYVTNTLRSPVTLTVTAGPPADESQ